MPNVWAWKLTILSRFLFYLDFLIRKLPFRQKSIYSLPGIIQHGLALMKVASGAPAMELFNRRRFSTCMAIFQTCLAVAHLLLLKSSMLQLKPNIYLKVSNPDLHIHWIPFIGNLLLKYIFQIWIIPTVKCAWWLMRFWTRIILIKSVDLS